MTTRGIKCIKNDDDDNNNNDAEARKQLFLSKTKVGGELKRIRSLVATRNQKNAKIATGNAAYEQKTKKKQVLQFLTEMQFQSKKFVSFYEREIGIEKIFSYCFENRYHVGEKKY